jgi:3-phosphoshikimate 1-carboxyvinyltransferase
MKLIIKKSKGLQGKIVIPPAKSHGWRILFLTGLAGGRSKIIGPKESKDWNEAIEGMKMLGAKFEKKGNSWFVDGIGKKVQIPDDVVRCGNSGPLLRYFGIIAAVLTDKYVVITGDESLRHNRLAQPVVEAINQLGGWAVSTKGDKHAPIIVKGLINGGTCTVDGAESQIVSALLMGCSLCKNNTEIFVTNVGERPWVELTISWLKKAGINIQNIGGRYDHYIVKGSQKIKPLGKVVVPVDWQSVPTALLAGIIIPGSKITIDNIDPQDVCPDRLVIEPLIKMGANITYTKNSVTAAYSPNLKGIRIDANDFTDQFVPLSIAAAFAHGDTIIYNNEIQRHKECDRISAVRKALEAMGVKVEERQDGLVIQGNGGQNLKGGNINCFKDHRMVMNFAIAGMRATGETVLSDAESLEKTFGDFNSQLRSLGAKINKLD